MWVECRVKALARVSAGVPPTQVHKHGNIGRIDVSAVLEPLDFILPQRELVSPVLDLSVGPSRSSTAEAEAPAPTEPENSESPEPGADPNPNPEEAEPSRPRTGDVEQDELQDTTPSDAGYDDDRTRAPQPLPPD